MRRKKRRRNSTKAGLILKRQGKLFWILKFILLIAQMSYLLIGGSLLVLAVAVLSRCVGALLLIGAKAPSW